MFIKHNSIIDLKVLGMCELYVKLLTINLRRGSNHVSQEFMEFYRISCCVE